MTGYKLRMRDELERRYGKLREQSIKLANEAVRVRGVKLALVDNVSYKAFKKWGHHPERRVTWDWPDAWLTWKLQYPKRFECATWAGKNLVGFRYGQTNLSKYGVEVRLH